MMRECFVFFYLYLTAWMMVLIFRIGVLRSAMSRPMPAPTTKIALARRGQKGIIYSVSNVAMSLGSQR